MTFWTRFLEKIGLRKPEPEPVRVAPLAPATPAPYIVAPVPITPLAPVGVTIAPLASITQLAPTAPQPVTVAPRPVVEPLPKPVAPGAGDLPDEFFERPAGVWWWRSPGNGQEYGPVDAAYDGDGIEGARHFRERIAASRWAQDPKNPASQQATADMAGLGYPIMTPEQIATTLAPFDASMALGREDLAYYQLSAQEMFALQNRGLKRVDVNAKINQYNK